MNSMNDTHNKLLFYLNTALVIVLTVSLGANQILTQKTRHALGMQGGVLSQLAQSFSGTSANASELTGDVSQDAISLVVSQGVPEVYGAELGVSFDQVQQSINIMGQFDPGYGSKKIQLTAADQKRYTDVGLRISCEYCCSAKSIVFQDGSAACGCAHSIAMRGLLAYLIQNHGETYSDDELLRELAEWKGMYFPKQMIQKMATQLQSGEYTPDTASLVLGVKLPQYGSGGKNAPLPSEIKNLPSMVGGC